MSTFQCIKTISVPAGENLNGDLYELLTINGSGQFVKADAATEYPVAILAEDPGRTTAAGDYVTVMDLAAGGIGLVKAGAAIAAGAVLVPSTTAGHVDDAASLAGIATGAMGFGIAMEAATASGQVIKFKAHPLAGSA